MPGEHSTLDLLEMDRDEARASLTVDEFERWEKLTELHDDASEQRDRWRQDDEQVERVVVHSDPDALGTEVDVFGNALVVHPERADGDEFREANKKYEQKYADVSADDVDALDPGERAELERHLLEMLDAIILKWNGVDWQSLPSAERERALNEAADEWGLMGLLKAWLQVVSGVREDAEEMEASVKSFRSEERASGRGNPPADRFS